MRVSNSVSGSVVAETIQFEFWVAAAGRSHRHVGAKTKVDRVVIL